MGFDTPDIVHGCQLSGPDVDVIGIAFAGVPMVSIGHNRHLAWTITTGMGDLDDIYAETLNPDQCGPVLV